MSLDEFRHKLSELVANRLTVDVFEDWFISESWGHYDGRGDPTSEAIAAVTHVLHSYHSGEIEEMEVARELARHFFQ